MTRVCQHGVRLFRNICLFFIYFFYTLQNKIKMMIFIHSPLKCFFNYELKKKKQLIFLSAVKLNRYEDKVLKN